MFSGIVAGTYRVDSFTNVRKRQDQRLEIDLNDLTSGLKIGSSVAVNGVCLTVVSIDEATVGFDVIPATLAQTNLRLLSPGSLVNIERALRFGDEIGGHLLSGHIADVAEVMHVYGTPENCSIKFIISKQWRKYCHTKGFVALDGVSLTLASFDYDTGIGCVNLIPETLERTTLKSVVVGSLLNFEVDPTTLAVVDTVARQFHTMHPSQD